MIKNMRTHKLDIKHFGVEKDQMDGEVGVLILTIKDRYTVVKIEI
jgi:hypothetical protein